MHTPTQSRLFRMGAFLRARPAATLLGLAIVLALFIFREYYNGSGLLFKDANFLWSPSLLQTEAHQFFHAWRPAQSGGVPGVVENASQGYMFVPALFLAFGAGLSTVLIFPALLIFGAAGFYLLGRVLGCTRLACAAAALFFVGNPWLWDQLLAGHVAITIAVMLSPWTFCALVRLLRGDVRYGFLLLAASALELASDPRITMFVFAGVLIAGAVAAFMSSRQGRRGDAFAVAVFCLAAVPFAFAVNGWWTAIYALVPGTSPVPPFYPPVEEVIAWSAYGDFAHTLMLSGYFIHFSWTRMLGFGSAFFALWFLAGLALLFVPAFAVAKRRPVMWLSLGATVFGLVMSMGSKLFPLPFLFALYAHVPFMALLREPIKFGYVAMFGMTILIALAITQLRGVWRGAILLATCCFVFPIFTGTLSNPDGVGFQPFGERDHYVGILSFLEREKKTHEFRIAFFPPWLAEQSLASGAFPSTNPFVFQSAIPVIDAKLINTATLTDDAAWRTFDGIYWGTDTHPAESLAELGVQYVVLSDNVSIQTPSASATFQRADAALNHYILDNNRDFVRVYQDGPYAIYKNMKFVALYRTPRLPVVVGNVAPLVRQALPAKAFGDSFSAGKLGTSLPPGASALGSDAVSRCIDGRQSDLRANAIDSVGKHSDWNNFWVASDWILRGPGDYRDRLFQRFALPFAYTESSDEISIPVQAVARSDIYVQAGTVATEATFHSLLDGQPPEDVAVSGEGFRWFKVGTVGLGNHRVLIRGGGAPLLVGSLATVPVNACARAAEPAPLKTFFIPGPDALATMMIGNARTTVDAQPGSGTHTILATPEGAVAATWDDSVVSSGQPFHTLTGLHRIYFFGPSGPRLRSAWTASEDAPFQLNPGSRAAGSAVHLVGGRWPQQAAFTVRNVPSNAATLLRFVGHPYIPKDGEVALSVPQGAQIRLATVDLSAGFMLVPYIGPSYSLVVRTHAGAAEHADLQADLRLASRLGGAQFVTISPRALPSSGMPLERPVAIAPIAAFSLGSEGLLKRADKPNEAWTMLPPTTGLALRLTHLVATERANAVLSVYYDEAGTQVVNRVASFIVGTSPSDKTLRIPILPFTRSVLFTLTVPAPQHAVLTLRSATLMRSSQLTGVTVRVPAHSVRGGEPIMADDSTGDDVRFKQVRGGILVGAFTYDPNWVGPNRDHWLVNSFENAWSVPPEGKVVYRVQRLYGNLLIVGLLLWLGALAAFVVMGMRRRKPSYITENS